jgi:UDP-glucose 4-epimerase
VSVLVTGGAGYIGSVVARALLARGEELVVLDVAESLPEVLRGLPGLTFVRADLRDGAALQSVLTDHDIDAVIHLAALKSVAASMRDPGLYFDNNVGGSLALLRGMQTSGIGLLVFSSSCAVYGEPKRLPLDEDCPLRPENPYGESKLLVERMLPWFEQRSNIRAVSLRYFNAAGATEDGTLGEDWRHAENLIPVAVEAALGRGNVLQVFGRDYPTPDGTAIRDYVHVLDLAEGHLRALDYLRAGGASATLNLGTGVGSSVLEVISTIEAVLGRPVPSIAAPRRPGDPAAVWADDSLARDVIGWEASRALRSIIETAVRWHTRSVS